MVKEQLPNFLKTLHQTRPKKECLTIRTLDDSDLGQFGPNSDLSFGRFGPWTIRTLVNSDLDHWLIRTHKTRSELAKVQMKIRSELAKVQMKIRSTLAKVRIELRSELTMVEITIN